MKASRLATTVKATARIIHVENSGIAVVDVVVVEVARTVEVTVRVISVGEIESTGIKNGSTLRILKIIRGSLNTN